MRIYFCRQGLTYIMAILQNELPEDEILACAPEQVAEAAREADVLIPTVSRQLRDRDRRVRDVHHLRDVHCRLVLSIDARIVAQILDDLLADSSSRRTRRHRERRVRR